ncbi:MAG: hypothetical protein ABIJ61_07970 [bacterium]
MMRRLKIEEIDSVGAVDEGDNPPASLLFWKRRKAPVGGVPEKGVFVAETVEPEELVKAAEEIEAEAVSEPVEAVVEIEEVSKQVEKIAEISAERDAAITALAEEVAKRQRSEWVEKAKPFELLLGSAETIGPALGKIADALPEEYARLEAAFKAALARQDLTKILGEVGKDSGESGSPADLRDRFVKEFRMLHPEATVEQARVRFWQDNPDMKQASRERI